MDREAFIEAVLSLVESIPAGRVMSYGAIAEAVGAGGPRQVGQVLSLYGGPVPWWRVVRADGRPPAGHEGEASVQYAAEATPLSRRPPDRLRVDLAQASWTPRRLASGQGMAAGQLTTRQ